MPEGIFCTQYKQCEDGKAKCLYYSGLGLCAKPHRLRCIQWLVNHQDQTSIEELLSHSEFAQIPVDLRVGNRLGTGEIELKKETLGHFAKSLLTKLPGVYSFSQIFGSYLKCRRCWYLEYVKRVKTLLTPHYFAVGSAGHLVLEKFLTGVPIQDAVRFTEEFADVETGGSNYHHRLAGIRAVCRVWAERHPDLVGKGRTEVYHRHPLLPMRAFVDFEHDIDDGVEMWEHKFASSLDYMPKYRAQSMFYHGLVENACRTVVNLIKKPDMRSNKPKRGESLEAYEERVYNVVLKDPRKWFSEITVEHSQSQMDDFNEQVLQVIDELEGCREKGWLQNLFPKNYGACKQMNMECKFMPLCESGRIDPTVYYVDSKPSTRDNNEAEAGDA
ncbi:MAG: hypothetical protein AMS21_01100 [Gemmatimonas sp. SG8_38_2]|nr:MAG: hypothetical protein AMS21_01100 [Gemmatimonas sp. SG8_38_2]